MTKKSNSADSALGGDSTKSKSEVYGRTRYAPPRGQQNSENGAKRYDATQR